MISQPVSYFQTDPRWRAVSYSAKGETTTIGASGCGPTAMAMVLATWCDPQVTPQTECAWALAHGYKAPHSGSYYGYFVPAGKRYGLTVNQLNGASIYGSSTSPCHAQAKTFLEEEKGLVIACMGKGTWTSSGHYVLVWGIQGNVVYINDPASAKAARTRGDYSVFRKQVKYYWTITCPMGQMESPREGKEELNMTIEEFLQKLTPAQAYALVEKANGYGAALPEPDWSKGEGHWQAALDKGLINQNTPQAPLTRCELTAILGRKGLL